MPMVYGDSSAKVVSVYLLYGVYGRAAMASVISFRPSFVSIGALQFPFSFQPTRPPAQKTRKAKLLVVLGEVC